MRWMCMERILLSKHPLKVSHVHLVDHVVLPVLVSHMVSHRAPGLVIHSAVRTLELQACHMTTLHMLHQVRFSLVDFLT